MKTCGICKLSYRSGGGMVYDGNMKRVRACQSCATRGVTIVPVVSGGAECTCGGKATVCETCAKKREHKSKVDRDVKQIAAQLRARAKAYNLADSTTGEFIIGKIEALEDAASFIETGKW